MSEYIVDFGDTSSAFVGLAMAQAIDSGATINERITRCRDCKMFQQLAVDGKCNRSKYYQSWTEPDGFCAWGVRRDT